MSGDGTAGAHVLDDPAWWALTSHHVGVAEVHGSARRYRPDVSVFAAVERLDGDGWADLAGLLGPGGTAVLARAEVPEPPAGWTTVWRGVGHQMLAPRRLTPPPALGARPLTDDDVPAAVALVRLTRPGPFAPRTVDLGGYLGVFDDGRLVAMAGGRFRPPGHREVSAVCTHPDARRRGLGGALTVVVASQFAADGDQPFLHVADDNVGARRVYDALGFTVRRTVTFAVVQAPT